MWNRTSAMVVIFWIPGQARYDKTFPPKINLGAKYYLEVFFACSIAN